MRNEVGLFAMIIVDRFHRQQVDRHVIDARHLFFEDEMIAKRLDAVEALQFRLLGDEERHLAFFQAGHVALQQVVSYEVESLFPSLLQVFAYDVNFGVEGNAVLYRRVGTEKLVEHRVVFIVSLGMQVEFQYVAVRMMLPHVLPEAYFSALLLVGAHNAFVYFPENHDFFFIPGK